jgi:hypothetical protein
MPRIAVQIGHVNSARWGPGATHEVETTTKIHPYLVAMLQKAGCQVETFGGDLPYGLTHDIAISLHCDAGTPEMTGYSLGFWEEMHPGSRELAAHVKAFYDVLGIRPYRENYTLGLHHYYGNSRWAPTTKFVLVECGFVSNLNERVWLQSHPQQVGEQIALGVLDYLNIKTKEESTMTSSSRTLGARGVLFEGHALIGKNGPLVEHAYLNVTGLDKTARVNVLVWGGGQRRQTKENTKNPPYVLKPSESIGIDLNGFGIAGPVTWRLWSDEVVLFSPDWRVSQ